MNDIEDIYPLSPAQEGMLFHSATATGGHGQYVETTTFRVHGALDTDALAEAWAAAAARHPALRTGFIWERISSPHQVVVPHADVRVDVEDLGGMPQEEHAAWLAAELERRRAPFDLGSPPLMRLLVVRLPEPDEHLVVWTYHHLLLDGWSAALLLAEVVSALEGNIPDRPAPPSFKEHIAWLRRQDPEPARAFWTAYLAGYGEPAVLTLPGVRPGASHSGTYRGADATVDADRTGRLRRLAAANGTTLSSLVEAAWGATVSRFSGRNDVVFGVAVAGRPAELPRAAEMIGMFINTVPVRLAVDPDQDAVGWITGFAAGRHRILDHQNTPLTDIRRYAGTAVRGPLFDTVVVFENYPDETLATLSGGRTRVADVRYETRTNYLVTLVVRTGEQMSVQAIADAAQVDESEQRALLDFFTTVLERLADRPDTGVRDLLALPPRAAARVEGWSGPDREPGAPAVLLPRLIAAAVAATPDHPAVVDGATTLTYRALDHRATALAARLHGTGVRAGDRVGVCLGRSADLLTAMLGVARAGAAFVPVDPSHPADRIHYILDDAETAAVICDDTGAPVLEGRGEPRVHLPGDLPEHGADAEAPAPPEIGPHDLAYVIYTSGSTGRPKGVAIGHGALANLVATLAQEPGLGAGDRFLALTTLTFDTSLAELLVPLAAGATVHVGAQTLGLNGRTLDRYVAEHAITALQATPSRYRALLETGWEGDGGLRLYSCGEAFPPDLAAPLSARGAGVWNMYGPTETTVYSSIERISPDTERVTVGRPVARTTLRILDGHGDPVPVGVVGELCIGGAGVAQGYWRRPELTEERFVPDPFAGGGARMFRTGDHARHLPDGRVEVLGRMDRQLKLHGYRIEPGEIEAVLLGLDGVGDAVATVREADLAVYVAPRAGADLRPAELRAELRRLLPSYMVPDTVTVLPEFPLTPAGKTDVLALPDPVRPSGAAEPGDPAEPGDTPAPDGVAHYEALLTKHMRDVLGVEEIGPDDDFFDLGGDSLRALRLAARIQADLQQDLDVELLFEYSTVREVAEALAKEAAHDGS